METWLSGARRCFQNIAVTKLRFPPKPQLTFSANQFFELVEWFKKQETQEARATGIDTEFDEKTQLLIDVHSRLVEYINGLLQELQQKGNKVEKE